MGGILRSDEALTGPLAVDEVLAVGLGLFGALRSLHERGRRAGGLRPERVILHREGARVVAASLEEPAAEGPRAVAWSAPESLGALRHAPGFPADLYAAGALLFTAATGRPPYGEGPAATLAHVAAPVPTLGPEWPVSLDAILRHLLRKDPAERYQTASAVLADLTAVRAARERGAGDPGLVPGREDVRQRLAPPALVSRTLELDRLRKSTGLVLLRGPSGVGKSRLATEFLAQAEARGVPVLQGRGRHALGHVARELARRCRTDAPRAEALRARLGPWAQGVRAALPELEGLLEEGAPGPERFGPDRTRAALARFLESLGEAVVFLDDGHLADEEVWEALSAWAADGRGPLVLVAAREERTVAGAEVVDLSPLGPGAVADLVRSMAGRLPRKALQTVVDLSGGSPFLAVELTRGLVESGALRPGSRGWRLRAGALEEVRLSGRGAEVLRHRLEQLPPKLLALLETAAVLGREVDPETLGALRQDPRGLEEARRRGLLLPLPEGGLGFSHDRLREALLERVEPECRRQAHRAAAEFLEGARPEAVESLAHHFALAGEAGRAAPYALRAARQARKRYALEAAERFYRMAGHGPEGTAGEDPEGLADVLRLRGSYREARERYGEARRRLAGRVDRARVEGKLGELALKEGDMEGARAHLEAALEGLGVPVRAHAAGVLGEVAGRALPGRPPAPPDAGEARLRVHLLDRLGHVLFYQGALGPLWANLRALREAEALGPGPELGTACALHACLAVHLPWLTGRALRFARRAVALQERHGDRWDLGCALGRGGYVHLLLGHVETGVQQLRRAVELFELTGDPWERLMSSFNLALGLLYRGDLAEARALALRTHGEAAALGDRFIALGTLRVLGRLGGDLPPEACFEGASGVIEVAALEARGLRDFHQGRLEEAARALARAVDRAGPLPFERAGAAGYLATVLRAQADHCGGPRRGRLLREARRAARTAVDACHGRYRTPLVRALREAGLLALERGQEARGRRLLDRSLETARQAGMRHEEALTLLERGRAGLRLAWPGAAAEKEQGERVLEALGARWDLPAAAEPVLPAAADRFAAVIAWGKALATARTRHDALEGGRLALERLLRAERCLLLDPREAPHGVGRDPVLLPEGDPLGTGLRSAMLVPVWCGARAAALLLAGHRQVEGLFGPEELRLAHFVAALCSAGLENAESFEERERSLQAVRRAEEEARALVHGVGVGIALVDAEARILEANEALAEMLGAELAGAAFADFIWPGDRARFRDCFGRGAFRLEGRYLGPSGRLIWGQVTATPLGARTVLSLADVSHRRLHQIALFQERERRLLSTELHDVFSQPLVGLGMQLEALRRTGEDPREGLGRAADDCRRLLDELSGLVFSLRAPVLDGMDLAAALDDFLGELRRTTGLEADLEVRGDLRRVRGLPALFLYRIVQEACQNVRRHAGARRVRLRLTVAGDRVRGLVHDDGRGFDPREAARRRRVGLRGMRERAELLGGRFRLRSHPGRGTWIRFELPVEEAT